MPRLRLAAAGAIGLAVVSALVLGLGLSGGLDAPASVSHRPVDPATACSLSRGSTRQVAVDVEGQGDRTALVRLPAHGGKGPLPLVIALHGAYGSGAFMERYSGFSKRAEADGFAVVYPDARGKRWTLQPGKGPDDVAFIGKLLDRLLAGGCIDASRVYVAGVSNGGGLAALLGCEMSGRLAAIAAVAGGYGELPDCRPDHSLSVLEIHGTADQVVPYHAAQGDVLEWLGRWVARDRCAHSPARAAVATRVTRFVWAWCRDRTVVEHFAVAGGQHAWPGADPPDPGPRVSLSATDEAWRFFAGRRRS
jgi:polyhydroxybutyrate depolymerase